MLDPLQALGKVDGKGELLPGGSAEPSMLDKHFPPGSLARAFLDTAESNVQSVIKNGNSMGCRYPATVQHALLQLLPKIGRTAYESLSELLPALPSYRMFFKKQQAPELYRLFR